jgi:oxygen-independent coproporphyrinogen-3 oxidase
MLGVKCHNYSMPLGLYISVPFCKTKCSYCNFASDVFSKVVFQRYVDRVVSDIDRASEMAASLGAEFDPVVDSMFLGGGTPTVLETEQIEALFAAVHKNLQVLPDAEITVECAPGTLSPRMLESFARCGVNRVSLGVQSFVDREAASVGRIHKAATVADDLRRLRAAGISNINVDLIAGLPHQSVESWNFSVSEAIACGAPHVSVYMLEVDKDSRLGREVLAGGTRYHAHEVPDDDLTADLYATACEKLSAAGIPQYEISNFASPGFESQHNLKYWTRQPYMGFGVDAHSMLRVEEKGHAFGPRAVRFASADSLEAYVGGTQVESSLVSPQEALEESFFLGLRLTRGVDLTRIAGEFGDARVADLIPVIAELAEMNLLERAGEVIRLTDRGRLLSNDVFERFVAAPAE